MSDCCNVVLRNCRIDARKTYIKIGNAGEPVSMGTYGYHASHVMNLRMIKCTMDDIFDRSRWGVVATNFMKNFLVEDCTLSRVDVHQGVSGRYIIRRSTIGHAGLNAIGRGQLIVEDSTLHGRNLVRFREDYGSTWDGEVLIRNSRWIPGNRSARSSVIFGMENDGMHDFGYPCSMPSVVRIDGLFIDDSKHGKNYKGVTFFKNLLDGSRNDRPSPYRLTERVEVRNVKTASGMAPRISDNPKMAKSIKVTGL